MLKVNTSGTTGHSDEYLIVQIVTFAVPYLHASYYSSVDELDMSVRFITCATPWKTCNRGVIH